MLLPQTAGNSNVSVGTEKQPQREVDLPSQCKLELRMSGAVSPLIVYPFMAVYGKFYLYLFRKPEETVLWWHQN
jgi:hypothetical protein